MKTLLSVIFLFFAAIFPTSAIAEGAIAISENENGWIATGFTSNEQTYDEAKEKAIKKCKKEGGKNCKIVAEFNNVCAAVARSRTENKSVFAVAKKSTGKGALKEALLICSRKNNASCDDGSATLDSYFAGACSDVNKAIDSAEYSAKDIAVCYNDSYICDSSTATFKKKPWVKFIIKAAQILFGIVFILYFINLLIQGVIGFINYIKKKML